METVFDLSNIASGIILATSILVNLKGVGEDISKLSAKLSGFKVVFGSLSLILGVIYLFRPGCAVFEIVGIMAGLVLLSDLLKNVPAIGEFLTTTSHKLAPFSTGIGIAAIVVGVMGLLNIYFLC